MKPLDLSVTFPKDVNHEYSPNAFTVSKIFGLPIETKQRTLIPQISIQPCPITFITGYSGSGKTSLLKAIQNQFPEIQLSSPNISHEKKVIDSFDGDIGKVISWLSKFGLGEARVMVTKIGHLSVGQKERLKLAKLLWKAPPVIIIDEFLSSLDRVTARIIAFQFQKVVRSMKVTCFVASAHDDLVDALFPDTLINMDFEGEYTLTQSTPIHPKLPEISEIKVSAGTVDDYIKMKRFHYMDQQQGDIAIKTQGIMSIQKAEFRGKLVGVRVFTKIFHPSLEKIEFFRKVNEQAVRSSRVIVHPSFRGLGISQLLGATDHLPASVKTIFSQSALALYFPFNQGLGYQNTQHVSFTQSQEQLEFQNLASTVLNDAAEKLHDSAYAQKTWSQLSEFDQKQLQQAALKCLVDYDVRHSLYIAEHLGISVGPSFPSFLRTFFSKRHGIVPVDRFWALLSDALHFPMQGMVKKLSATRSDYQNPGTNPLKVGFASTLHSATGH